MAFLIIACACLHLLAICWLFGQETRFDRIRISYRRHVELSTESTQRLTTLLGEVMSEVKQHRDELLAVDIVARREALKLLEVRDAKIIELCGQVERAHREAVLAKSTCGRSVEASRAVSQQLERLQTRPGVKR